MNYIFRVKVDAFSRVLLKFFALSGIIFFCFILGALIYKSIPIVEQVGVIEIFFNSDWDPVKSKFGLGAFISNTFILALMAVSFSFPISLGAAIYLAEFSSRRFLGPIRSLIDLLAAIPSIVYGLWGVLAVVPFSKKLALWLWGKDVSGYSLFSAALVLSIMVTPIIVQVVLELLLSLPKELKESALALGATKWQMIKHVLLRKVSSGVLSAVLLATVRALGETMAVMMLAGNVNGFPHSVFDPIYPLPALMANTYGELFSVPLFESSIMMCALSLLIIVLLFNITAKIILNRILRKK